MREHLPMHRYAAVALLLLAAALATSAGAEDLSIRNCTWCHGTSAQGYTPAPRLAGQRAAYIQGQLHRFRTQARNAPLDKQYMWAAAQNLDDRRIHALAVYFSELPPRAAKDGDPATVARGKDIYQSGLPSENIVACVVCHGPDAQGVGGIPRLGGLDYGYLKRRLEQWNEGYSVSGAAPMPHIAGQLSSDKIDALASYLSFVRVAHTSD